VLSAGAVWVVTGASRGIGEAVALATARRGARVALFARTEEDLERVAKAVEASGGEAFTIVGDARRAEDIERLFSEVLTRWGRVDVLVNSAGRGIYASVTEGHPADWRVMLDLNLFGVFCASQLAVRAMRETGGGTIVNLSSVASRKGLAGWAVYNATKFGLNGFSEALRLETLKDNIRVLVIEPGAVDTGWGEGIPEEFRRLRGSVTNLGAEDVAETIVFAATRPAHVSLNEILIRPTEQER